MHRLLVAFLAAVDAALAAAGGLALLLAPLTLLWMLVWGASADWAALWPTTGTLWQLGHAVPVSIALPELLIVEVGLAPEAASFSLSLAPLALLVFTLVFAVRSGARAARAGEWLLGSLAGAATFALLSTAVALTAGSAVARTPLALAIVLPTATYLLGALGGGLSRAWAEGDGGAVDRVRRRVDDAGEWAPVPAAAARGAAVAVTALTGAGALAVTLAVLLRGGEVVSLFEAARVDALGAAMVTVVQVAYLPTLIVWAVSWLAGPGFAVGSATAVSPAGTQLGVVPGVPVFGLLPEGDSFWMLIVVLVPVGAGALAGWMIRSRLVWQHTGSAFAPRATIAAAIAALTAVVAAVAGALASGGIGPGRMGQLGPSSGWFALAIGVEVLVGAGILLLAPRHRDELAEERTDRWVAEMGASPLTDVPIAAPRAGGPPEARGEGRREAPR